MAGLSVMLWAFGTWLALAVWAVVSLAMARALLAVNLYRFAILLPARPVQSCPRIFISCYDINYLAATGMRPGSRRVVARVVAGVKRYKFQALVTLYAGKGREPDAKLGPAPRRMVLRGRNGETGRSQFFAALVSCDDEGPFRPGSPQWLVTLRLVGDDVADYFGIGGHFDLWLGADAGRAS